MPRNSRALACATILPDAPGPRLLEVSPSGLSENRYVPMGQMLEYQLSFENTASDTVQDLLLTHPLPASLDAGTLRLGPASHPYVASLQGDSLKTLFFAFSGLDLPGGQRGFVSFQLQPNNGLEAPAVVGHRALVQFGNGPALASDSAWVTYADTVLLSPAYDDAYDALPPTIALSLPDGEYWNRPFQVRVDLSEPVALSASMFRVENGQAGALTGGGLRYNLRVVPQNEGPVAVSLEAGTFVDASGNPVLEGSSATAVFDITPPRFAISITASGESLASPFELSIESSEITTALGAGSLRLDAGELQSFERDGDRYLLQALADENGQLIFELPAGSATDRAGNPNLRAGGSFRLPHIDGQGEFFDIILFPNPATDLLRVEQRLPGQGIVIQVLDVSGRLMGAVTTDEQVETIDVSPLRPGLYIVRVFHPDYIESRTFMKR
jgi:hypothetical protein